MLKCFKRWAILKFCSCFTKKYFNLGISDLCRGIVIRHINEIDYLFPLTCNESSVGRLPWLAWIVPILDSVLGKVRLIETIIKLFKNIVLIDFDWRKKRWIWNAIKWIRLQTFLIRFQWNGILETLVLP